MEVVRAGRRETPPVTPPRQLVPLLRFAKLPDRALSTVADVLDRDEDLRTRVVEAVRDLRGGPPDPVAVLFLERPDGWDRDITRRLDDDEREARRAEAEARDRTAARRARTLEEEAATLAGALDRAREEVAQLRAALAQERAALAEARTSLRSAHERTTQLERERDAAHRRASAAERARSQAVEELDRERARHEEAASDAVRRRLDAQAGELRRALGAAAELASSLTHALAQAASALDDATPAPAAPGADPSARRPSSPWRRPPAPMPPGVTDDSVEAAEHLVRLDGCVLIIDGYNASLRVWEGLPLREQRERLVAAADELAARVGVEIVVVFDGAEADASMLARPARHRVSVRFTASDVEADDAILDLVDAIDPRRPVVAASDDHRVRAGAVERGANVLSQQQLFAVLRRAAG